MNKKVSIVIIFMMLFAALQVVPTQRAHGLDLDDPANIFTSIQEAWQVTRSVGLEPAVKIAADKVLDKITQSTLNWANGGFEGEPGFINDFDGFLKGTEHEILSGAFKQAEDAATGVGLDTLRTGVSAELNNQINRSGVLSSARTVATAIALQGSKDLNFDPITSIIDGDFESLSKITGSKADKDAFKDDIVKGGLVGFTSLIVPENTDVGLTSAITQAVSAKKAEDVERLITDLNLPTKFLSKTDCVDGRVIDGRCTGREVVSTPGDLVGEQVGQFLTKDKDQAIAADGLIGSLVKSIGDITNGLLNAGLSSLSQSAGEAFFGSEQQGTFSQSNLAGADLRSEYDVLGISSEVSEFSSTSPSNPRETNIFSSSTEDQFIGGPEDQNRPWNERPQIIINLQENLETAILNAEQELAIYQNSLRIAKESAQTTIELDRCIPGPDYGWESRYTDTFTSDEHKIALQRSKDMINDPLVNIPGAAKLNETLNQIISFGVNEEAENGQRRQSLRRVVPTLQGIRDSINNTFQQQKSTISDDLVLYESEWDNLSPETQKNLGEIAATGTSDLTQNSDTNSNQTYLVLKRDRDGNQIETVDSLLASNPEKVKNAVLDMAWDLWRRTEDPEKKNNFRITYYSAENDLSNDQFLAIATAKESQVITASSNAVDQLNDCLIFKAYAMGTTPRNELRAEVIGGPSDNPDTEEKVRRKIDRAVNTAQRISIFNPGLSLASSLFGSRGEITLGPTENAPSRSELIRFLEEEYELFQTNPRESLFSSDTIISPSSISNSILGFTTQAQTDDHFRTFHPDGTEPLEPGEERDELDELGRLDDSIIHNAKTVADIFAKDRVYNSYNRETGARGVLFCRNTDNFDIISGSRDRNRTTCLFDWYITPILTYEAAFNGVRL